MGYDLTMYVRVRIRSFEAIEPLLDQIQNLKDKGDLEITDEQPRIAGNPEAQMPHRFVRD